MSRFLQVNTNLDDVIDLIVHRIKNKVPFSLTRYGHGEISILNNSRNVLQRKADCTRHSYKYRWQHKILYPKLREIIFNGIKHADIIGLLDKNGLLKDQFKHSEELWSIKKGFIGKKWNKME